MGQKLLTLPEYLSSYPVFTGVRVPRSLVLYVCFVDCCLSFCSFSFDHCVVCSSAIYVLVSSNSSSCYWKLLCFICYRVVLMSVNIINTGSYFAVIMS